LEFVHPLAPSKHAKDSDLQGWAISDSMSATFVEHLWELDHVATTRQADDLD
jgi:hypothetical protein